MKIQPECRPCLIKRSEYEANLINPELAERAMAISKEVMERRGIDVSAIIASEIHSKVYELLGTNDPYFSIKLRSTETALSLLPQAQDLVEGAEDRLRAAVQCAIAGNVLDFGIRTGIGSDPEGLKGKFKELATEGLGVDDLERARVLIGPGSKLLYFTDNVGEIVFDTLLVKELKAMGAHVTLVVKGGPILTDATEKEVEELDMPVDRVLTTNSNAVGVDFNRITDELRELMDSCDLIVAKGMANFESFTETEYGPILYLLRAKCAPIARHIGADVDMNVARLCNDE